MASYPQLASLATYEFDSAIFRLNLGNSLYNVVFISEHGVSEFGFFVVVVARVAEEFFEVARVCVFYTGEITGCWLHTT